MKPFTINTHIDCLNNSKCSVRDILLAIKQGAFGSVFCNIFCYEKGYVPIAYAPQESTGVQNVSVIILPVLKTIFQHWAEFSCSKTQKMAYQ